MVVTKKTWREKRFKREERCSSGDSNQRSGSDEEEMAVNMVLELPVEFRPPDKGVAVLAVGAKPAFFQNPEDLGTYMWPLFVMGYLQGKPLHWIMVDGGVEVNVMPLATFEKMGYHEGELMKTNTSPSAFSGEIIEGKQVMSVELTIGSKTLGTHQRLRAFNPAPVLDTVGRQGRRSCVSRRNSVCGSGKSRLRTAGRRGSVPVRMGPQRV
jgi:hypothetical protein